MCALHISVKCRPLKQMPSKLEENHDKTQSKFQVDASFLKQIPNNQKNQKKRARV